MATYFNGAQEIRPDGLQTLYLMNPGFPNYPDSPLPTNMILMNSAMSAISPPQHLVGIPVATSPLPDSNQWSSMMPMNNSACLSQKPEQGLSLSLSEPPMPASISDEEVRVSSLQSVIMGSKYLKAAQQLLEEVVDVGKGFKCGVVNGDREGVDVGEESTNPMMELTISERQELQMKKAKLVSMLDEVEQRYKQYHNKMRLLVSSFEAAAGPGSAKTYTAVALQTISRQFRCLRDAMASQIRSTTRSLGEEDCLLEGSKSKSSMHRFVDRHLRQRRAFQQLGMTQHNCWRPQRGLPERSVSVLRAWLIEHFLHPYPKDSEKQMLAKQTGLTRSQVSNWFINARVRLWKPMVEEMYMEELKEQEQSNNANEDSSSKCNAHHENSPPPLIELPPSADGEFFMQPYKLKKASSDECMSGDDADHEYSLIASPTGHGLEFGEYSVGEIGRFGLEQFAPRFAGNGVSLTLGLTHYGGFSLSGAQPSYISSESVVSRKMAVEVCTDNNGYAGLNNNASSLAHPLNAYENINIQSTKLLPDFVA